MSSQFEDEAETILKNAPAPDAEASTIREAENGGAAAPRRRGRPPGSNKNKSVKTKTDAVPRIRGDFDASAKAVNTVVFSLACVFTGTKEAWPENDKAEVMDKALSRYMEIKDYTPPPEAALLAAYAQYISDIAQKESVKAGIAKRFGGFKGKFAFISKIKAKFTKNNQSNEKGK